MMIISAQLLPNNMMQCLSWVIHTTKGTGRRAGDAGHLQDVGAAGAQWLHPQASEEGAHAEYRAAGLPRSERRATGLGLRLQVINR